jgi:acyl-CoA synthetase (AMP-forming)/AMP-acid ligase II
MTLFEMSEIRFQNLNEILDRNVLEVPERVFLKLEPKSLTYAQFQEQVIRCANVLLALNVKKGDYIGIQMGNSFEFCISIYACYRIGAIATPLIALWKAKEVGEALEKAKIETLIIKASMATVISKATKTDVVKNIIAIGEDELFEDPKIKGRFRALLDAASNVDPKSAVGWTDMASCHFTSGTTGDSKGVLHNHLGYLYTALVHARTFNFKKPIYAVHLLPLYHIFGFAVLHSCVYLQGTLKMLDRIEPQYVLNGLKDPEMTFFAATPSIYNMLIRQPNIDEISISPYNEVWVSGAGKLPADTEKALNEKLLKGKVILCNCYGGTEDISTGTTTFFNPAPNTIGKAMAGINIEVVDDAGNVLPPGKDNIGMIVNQSPAIMQGYLGDPKAADPVDHAKSDPCLKPINNQPGIWYWSGDMAYKDAATGNLYLTDRSKDIIKSAERLVYPYEVEAIIMQHPDVKEVAVVGVPHEIFGETILAVVVPDELNPEKNKKLEEELIKMTEEGLAHYKVPRIWWFKQQLQINTMGKVLKRLYRDEYIKKLESATKKKEKATDKIPK